MVTRYQADRENNLLFGRKVVWVDDVFYIALSSTSINEDGTGLTEPDDINYKRIEVLNDEYHFTQSENGIIKNATEWRFNISTKAWSSPITHIAIMDGIGDSNVLYYDKLETPIQVAANQVVIFNPQSIQIRRSGL